MAGRSTIALYDRLIDGGLLPTLTRWRQDGNTYAQMTRRLRDEFDIDVDISTVYRWLNPPSEGEVA